MSNRRGQSSDTHGKAIDMSMTLNLPVANVLTNPSRDWSRIAAGKGSLRMARGINIDWKKFSQDHYLFTHATICCSVETEADGHTIKPACSELVNDNGNAWTNPVLLATFRSFVGAENYLEHCQIPELSKGKIVDAVIRPVKHISKTGEISNIYYVDILVATSKKHEQLVRDIESGILNTLSMGCEADFVQCSRCGQVFGDGQKSCHHIEKGLLTTYLDKNGVERIVSELCGFSKFDEKQGIWVGVAKSVKFIEASWVENPAFKGAVVNHYVSELSDDAKKILSYSTEKLQDVINDLFKIRVADKSGMMVMRVAMNEMIRRRREGIAERLAMSMYTNSSTK